MNNITYKFDVSKENKEFIEHNLELYKWSFQAKGFYEKMGFTVYGKLENHPPYATDYLLKKVLMTDKNDFPEPIK